MNLNLSVLAAVLAGVVATVNVGNALPFEDAPSLRGSDENRDLKATAVAGFYENLGQCHGAVCGTWGDPHVVTCDGLEYDCQGLGIFTYMKNKMYHIQATQVGIGKREQQDVDGWNLPQGATITNDIAIDFVADPNVPVIQLGFGEIHYRGDNNNNIPSEEGCNTGVHFYPLNMPGTSRSIVSSPQECREKCKYKWGCKKFQYWADGGCHLNNQWQTPIENPKHWSRVLTGTMNSDCGKPVDNPEMVGTKNEIEKHGSMKANSWNGYCPLLMYLDGDLEDISTKAPDGEGFLYGELGDDNYVRQAGKKITIVNKLSNGKTSEIQMHLKGNGAGEHWSCHWDFYVCLPESGKDLVEESVGLLGSPNNNKWDDWMDPQNKKLEVQNSGWNRHKKMIDYCVNNWCVSQSDSIIAYHGDTTYEDFKCGAEKYEEFDIGTADCLLSEDQILFACSTMTTLGLDACIIDCCFGGCEDLHDEDKFLKTITTYSDEPKNDDSIFIPKCDSTDLESTKDTVCPNNAGIDIVKVHTTIGDQPLPEGADVFYEIVTGQQSDGMDIVSFKINNPFAVNADVYIKHDKQALSSFTVPTCDARPHTPPGCIDDSDLITAACHSFEGQTPFALVQVYFASIAVDSEGEQATVDKCCGFDDVLESGVGIVEYTFEIKCACPDGDDGSDDDSVGGSEDEDCEGLEGLTLGFSAATGDDQWSDKCYPPVTIEDLLYYSIPGRDDSVAVFVGGNYNGVQGAEVEGNMVVLGNLNVEGSGPSNFVSVGGGTHVLPNSGGDCIIVGGDLSADRNIQVFNQNLATMSCDIVYKGSGSNLGRWKTLGDVRHDSSYDMDRYIDTKAILAEKSQYWKGLDSTGTVDYKNYGEGQTTYVCNNKNEIQVFNIEEHQRKWLSSVDTIVFGDDCEGKTILINVRGTGDVLAKAGAMHFKGKKGYGPDEFSTCLTENILWNFPDADNVEIGVRTSEWHGSVLVGGNLLLTTSGHSGRTMVLGDLDQSKGGSEFHTYQYNPPIALPDPPTICALKTVKPAPTKSPTKSPTAAAATPAPTKSPTQAPTAAPVRSGTCKARSLADIQADPNWKETWSTDDYKCNRCTPPNPKTWYPCDTPDRICEGNCMFNDGKPNL